MLEHIEYLKESSKKIGDKWSVLGSCLFHAFVCMVVLSYQYTDNPHRKIIPETTVSVELIASLHSKKTSTQNNTHKAIAKIIKPMSVPVKIPLKPAVSKIVKNTILHKASPKNTVTQEPIPKSIIKKPAIHVVVKTDTLVTGSIAPSMIDRPQKTALTQVSAQEKTKGKDNKAAVALYQPKAKYTATMLRQRMRGVVSVRLFFDTKGRVSDYQLVQRTRYHVLNQAVVSACRQYRIKPPQKLGKPIGYSDLCVQEMNYN